MQIAVLPGDGIGLEIVPQAVKVLRALERPGVKFEFTEAPVGGAAIDLFGTPLPNETLAVVHASDAILFGALADAEGSAPTKLGQQLIVDRQLIAAHRAPVRWIERQDRPATGQLPERQLLVGSDRQSEARSLGAGLQDVMRLGQHLRLRFERTRPRSGGDRGRAASGRLGLGEPIRPTTAMRPEFEPETSRLRLNVRRQQRYLGRWLHSAPYRRIRA
jgi:hypothetical protein